MRTIIAIALALAASVAKAAPIYLSCEGEWKAFGRVIGNDNFPISVDTDTGIVTYEGKMLKLYNGSNAEIRAAESVPGQLNLEIHVNPLTDSILIENETSNFFDHCPHSLAPASQHRSCSSLFDASGGDNA